jgi:hypothetical protein
MYPFRRRRIIDLTRSLKHARATGVQQGCDTANETIDTLLEQMRVDREAMRQQFERLREQFSKDLAAVAAELRSTKQELFPATADQRVRQYRASRPWSVASLGLYLPMRQGRKTSVRPFVGLAASPHAAKKTFGGLFALPGHARRQ